MSKVRRDMFYGAKPETFELAKGLRNHVAETEQMLWSYLSKNQLVVKFRRQHPINNYIADFYCHEYKLVVELDGSIHNNIDQKERDSFRNEEMKALGITVLRFKNQEVIQCPQKIIQSIKDTLVPPLGG